MIRPVRFDLPAMAPLTWIEMMALSMMLKTVLSAPALLQLRSGLSETFKRTRWTTALTKPL